MKKQAINDSTLISRLKKIGKYLSVALEEATGEPTIFGVVIATEKGVQYLSDLDYTESIDLLKIILNRLESGRMKPSDELRKRAAGSIH